MDLYQKNIGKMFLKKAFFIASDRLHAWRRMKPHIKMLSFPRKVMSETSMHSWLLAPGDVLLCHFVRSKSDPLCQQLTILNANPTYTHILFSNGHRSTLYLLLFYST